MKMLRVVLAVSNFLEAPNGGGAGGNQQPAGPSSLRERCDGRGTTHTPPQRIRAPCPCGHANTSQNRLHQAQTATLWCARRLADHPNVPGCNQRLRTCLAGHCGHHSVAVRRFRLSDGAKEDPPFAAGESREETTN